MLIIQGNSIILYERFFSFLATDLNLEHDMAIIIENSKYVCAKNALLAWCWEAQREELKYM